MLRDTTRRDAGTFPSVTVLFDTARRRPANLRVTSRATIPSFTALSRARASRSDERYNDHV